MTSEKHQYKRIAAGVVVALTLLVGCGNYSNEDLEYMNALPERDDLAANLPQARSAVLADTAELYRLTYEVTRAFNGSLEAFLRLIEAIRSYSPTSRTPLSRTWGPFPAEKHPGWLVQMVISRAAADSNAFSYWVGFQPVSDQSGDWLKLISGTFAASGGVRRGMGSLDVDTRALRAAGFDPELGFLERMNVDMYNTDADPITVHTTLTNLPNPFKPDEIRQAVYDYREWSDRRGEMTFNFKADSVPGLAVETFSVVSRWQGGGAGRSDVQVVEGDGAGAQWAQCWDARFQPTYTNKPWAPAENLGDPSACPDIPAL